MQYTYTEATPYNITEERELTNVKPEDAEFFEANNIRISMQMLRGDKVNWLATIGTGDSAIVLTQPAVEDQSLQDTLSLLRADCEVALNS